MVAELAAGRPLYDAGVRNRELLKIYGDASHALHPAQLHRSMVELQGMSHAFHDFLDEVFQSSAERPFAVDLLENNIWLEGQVWGWENYYSASFAFCLCVSASSCVYVYRLLISCASWRAQATVAEFATWLNGPDVLHVFV